MHDYTNKYASNMSKPNKDINIVYRSLVHKIYIMQQLQEIQINCKDYNFKR